MTDRYAVLKDYFGHTEFREGQQELIDCLVQGRDVLGIMPTGAGKSICYQVPALMLDGVTIVISPLISLMKDQVNALVQSGVKAAYLNSSLSQGQYVQVLKRAQQGSYKILYVAPERLSAPAFSALVQNLDIAMVTVDEAHCISQWGQDFRPSYLKIVEFIDSLPCRPVVGAFTATATHEVREDIARSLRLDSPLCVTTGFDRENLSFEVRRPRDKLAELLTILGGDKRRSAIVYCSTRKAVEEVCTRLGENGYSSTRYHAGLAERERHGNQDDFIFDRSPVMVATNAFGMGIDKSNVSLVVHYNMPKNIESYYQEAGRAGRDGGEAQCILLYSGQDVRTNQFLITHSDDNPELSKEEQAALRRRDLERLKVMTFYCTTSDCLRAYILNYFGEKTGGYCGNCSNCNTNFETVDITVNAQKILSCVLRAAQRGRSFGAAMIVDILRGSKNERILRLGMDTLSTYGIMSEIPVHRARGIITHLENEGYLAVGEGEFPVLNAGARADEVLRQGKRLIMKLPKEQAPRVSPAKQTEHVADAELFEKLRELRALLANKASVPAYVVFTDSALRDMCAKQPTTRQAFLEVSGVGAAKLEKYGDRFTSLIVQYLAKKE
ncbi:MAG: DNA helicase RecQ [Acetanaerobacterium sp.]